MMHATPPAGFKPLDPGRVNPMDPVEMAYWCERFECPLADLERAVRQVGEHVTELRRALRPPHDD